MNSLLRTDTARGCCAFALAWLLVAWNAAAAPYPVPVDAPAQGVLLVAKAHLFDPNFARTVVLLTDHGILGSVGLVLNRPSALPVIESIPDLAGLEDADIVLRYGGPLGTNSIRLLVGSEESIEEADELVEDVYFVNSSSLLHDLLTTTPNREAFTIHYYAGFAAWSPGQLDAEIARGDWLLVEASAALVFNDDDARMWEELMETLAGTWVLRENADTRPAQHHPSIVNTVTNPHRSGRPVTPSAYNRGHKTNEAARFASLPLDGRRR